MIDGIINKIFPSGNIGKDNLKNREEWLARVLKSIPDGSSILDAGAGECQYKKFCSHLNYTSQDFSQYTGEGDMKGLQMGKFNVNNIDIVSDITSIPVPDGLYDAVMCIEVIEHVPEPIRAINELHRVLKVGGMLILTAPFCSLTHYSPYHFSTGFNKYFYDYVFKDKFQIIEIVPNGNYFSYLAQELNRLKSMARKYSHFQDSIFYTFALKLILFYLNKFSKGDNSSSELLCYGFNVLGRKV